MCKVERPRLALPQEAHGLEQSARLDHLNDTQVSGKLAVLCSLLNKWLGEERDSDNKVLIFSASLRMLEITQHLVESAFPGAAVRLDGKAPAATRQQLVFRFNTDPSCRIFLVSKGVGGEGINLTAANKVVLVEPHWNPAKDQQSQDRAFRLGQRRDVAVYRLLAQGTIEELIYTRGIYKQQQAAIALHDAKEERYFHGVQGVRGEEGELWGIMNLFEEAAHDALFTRDARAQQILGNYRVEEAPALPGVDGETSDEEGGPRHVVPDGDELEAVGVVAMHCHDDVLGRGEASADSQEGHEDAAGAAPQEAAGQALSTTRYAEALVAWMGLEGVPPLDAARWLLGLTQEQRSLQRCLHATKQPFRERASVPPDPWRLKFEARQRGEAAAGPEGAGSPAAEAGESA